MSYLEEELLTESSSGQEHVWYSHQANTVNAKWTMAFRSEYFLVIKWIDDFDVCIALMSAESWIYSRIAEWKASL